jgi:hypothetical protein
MAEQYSATDPLSSCRVTLATTRNDHVQRGRKEVKLITAAESLLETIMEFVWWIPLSAPFLTTNYDCARRAN